MQSAREAEMQCLARDQVTVEVVTALRAAGVRPILLKGAAYKAWLYADGTPRAYRDTDLLVAPGAVGTAEDVLRQLGFEHDPLDDLPFDKPWHGHEWIRAVDGSAVDLHRTLIGATAPVEVVWRVLSASTEALDVGGVALEMLDEPRRTLHVALHAAQDGRRKQRTVDDLERAVAMLAPPTWALAAAVAHQIGAGHAMGAGLRMALGGAPIADGLGLSDDVPLEVRLRSHGAIAEAVALEWFVHLSLSGKVGFIRSKLFPPPAFLRAWTPVARHGHAGLAVAYFVRAAWLVMRLPVAVRRRAAERSWSA